MIRTGNDYRGKPGYLSFDEFTVIDDPCPTRESRVFSRTSIDGMGQERKSGTDYGSHSLKLARRTGGGELVILVQHGGGRELCTVREIYIQDGMEGVVMALADPVQRYALLYSIWDGARREADQARTATRSEWAQAFVEKRLKSRRKGGRIRVEILPVYEGLVNETSAGRFTGTSDHEAHGKAAGAAKELARTLTESGAITGVPQISTRRVESVASPS